MRHGVACCLLLTAVACSGSGDADRPPADGGAQEVAAGAIPDGEIGLVSGSVFDVPDPEPVQARTSMPGEEPVLPRPYPLAPPTIPHGVDDFLPITRESNYCIVCHNVEEKVAGEPTPIPDSHFIDMRNAPEVRGESVAGARHNCLACHARATDAEPLVASEFRPD